MNYDIYSLKILIKKVVRFKKLTMFTLKLLKMSRRKESHSLHYDFKEHLSLREVKVDVKKYSF